MNREGGGETLTSVLSQGGEGGKAPPPIGVKLSG
jgi:hypothetical protein